MSDNIFKHLPRLDARIDNLDDIARGRHTSVLIRFLQRELGLLSKKAWSNDLVQVWQLQLQVPYSLVVHEGVLARNLHKGACM